MVQASANGDANSNSFAKTICSICFEDLKPLVEDLQSISVCGHVFHELCLQQWFEYCPNLKKRSCPICKQACTNATVGRLYFQSVGDTNDCSSQKPKDNEENPEVLRNEVNRLEGKVGALSSSLEQKQKEVKEVQDELLFCNEKLKSEVALKNELLTQTAISQQLLRVKSEELDRSTLESTRSKERSMALARELAAYRLAYDMDLKEEEAMKLASLGDGGSREGNYLLIKSLDSHKRSYKELLAKCNDLGRREARNSEELESAHKKINKLKLKVRELATAVEIKENEALRVLKDQNIKLKKSPHAHQMKKPSNEAGLDESSDIPNHSFLLGKEELLRPSAMSQKITMNKLPGFTHESKEHVKGPSTNEHRDMLCSSTSITGSLHKTSIPCADNNVVVEECHDPRPVTCLDGKNNVEMVKSDNEDGEMVKSNNEDSRGRKRDRENEVLSNMDEEVICLSDIIPVQHTGKATSTPIPASQPGIHCFTGGLLGPDGTNRHLGKWCKKSQNQGSDARSGDLIAVGADGRGGKIKFMRSLHQSSMDINETSSLTKKRKQSAKPNMLRGQGVLQIDHFFRRTGE